MYVRATTAAATAVTFNATDKTGDTSTMRRRMKLMLRVVMAVVAVWLAGDFIYSRIVARRLDRWEASVARSSQGVAEGAAARTIGSGQTALLLVHGINASPGCFYKMAPALADEGFTCRVMRLPGFAEPIERYAEATKEQWLSAVKSELDDLKARHERVVIVAHSLGGAVAISHLLAHPESVDAAVLLAPAVEVSNRRSPLLPTRAWHEIGRRILWFTTITESPFADGCHDPAGCGFPGKTAYTPTSIAQETFELIDANRSRAGELGMPLLMVLASDDPVIDVAAAKEFFSRAPHGDNQLLTVPDSGHMLPVDRDWATIVKAIARFSRAAIQEASR